MGQWVKFAVASLAIWLTNLSPDQGIYIPDDCLTKKMQEKMFRYLPSRLYYKTHLIPTLKDSRTALRLSLSSPLKPDVKSRMKM